MVIRKLIWKEWREQRWKLALGCVMLLGITVVGLQTRMIEDQVVMGLSLLFGSVVLPVFVSMDVVAAERADGSLASLLKLPVAPWKILTIKTAMAVICCVVPVLLAATAAILLAGNRELDYGTMARMYRAGVGLAVSSVIWILAFSIRQPSEARVAIVAVAVVIGCFLFVIPYGMFDDSLPDWVMIFMPGGHVIGIDPHDADWSGPAFAVQAVYAAALFAWTIRRFSTMGRLRR